MFSIIGNTFKLLTWDLLRDLLYWPVWWYTDGLSYAWHTFIRWSFSWQHRLGLGIWVRNWFRPMYAQYDWQGRLISFFFRTVTILFKTVQFFVVFFVFGLMLLVYILAPVTAVIFLILSLLIV